MFAGVPLFLSHVLLSKYRKIPKSVTTWGLDSGGFTQLGRHLDGWSRGCEEPYVEAVARYMTAGGLEWVSPQDWMCEPQMLRDRSIAEHQERTVANYLRLTELAPEFPWAAVVQGFGVDDYHRCVDLYASAGVDLATHPRVGIGSVCRRQHTDEIVQVVSSVVSRGIALHGFGVKMQGLQKMTGLLASADSMSWSIDARRTPVLMPGHSHGAKTLNCSNCPTYALAWRARLLDLLHSSESRAA